MRAKTTLLAIVLSLIVCAAPTLALFGPPSQVFKGRVNYIQPTNFTLLTDNSQLIRVMVAQDRSVPAQVQVGVRVEVKAVQGQDGLWYLDKFEKIELQPSQSSTR
jgi:hypothetical protein